MRVYSWFLCLAFSDLQDLAFTYHFNILLPSFNSCFDQNASFIFIWFSNIVIFVRVYSQTPFRAPLLSKVSVSQSLGCSVWFCSYFMIAFICSDSFSCHHCIHMSVSIHMSLLNFKLISSHWVFWLSQWTPQTEFQNWADFFPGATSTGCTSSSWEWAARQSLGFTTLLISPLAPAFLSQKILLCAQLSKRKLLLSCLHLIH